MPVTKKDTSKLKKYYYKYSPASLNLSNTGGKKKRSVQHSGFDSSQYRLV